MSEILNENLDTVEETTEVTEEVTESIEVPIDEPIETEPTEETPVEPMILERANPLCVISKDTFGQYAVRDIQSNSAWSENPYGEDYAVVPDEMVTAILETKGFCNIMLSEDGTEVVNFTAREIPEITTPEPEPTEEQKRIAELEKAVVTSEQEITDLDLQDIETQQALTDMDIRLMALEG